MGTGEAYASENAWLRMEEFGGWIKLLAGCIVPEEVSGVKALARNPRLASGTNLVGLVLLYHARENRLLAIMDAVHITAVRTGAGGGLAARYLARRDSRTVGVLGTGVQARMNLEALKIEFLGLRTVRVFSRNEANRAKFVREMEAKTGLEVLPCERADEAVRNADIVITATNSPTPILQREWLAKGTCVLMMGIKTEVHAGCFRGAKIVVDDVDVATEDGKIAGAFASGDLHRDDIYSDLASLVLEKLPGRVDDDEITFFDSSGAAAQDLVCANHCYQRALELEIGSMVDLEGEPDDVDGDLAPQDGRAGSGRDDAELEPSGSSRSPSREGAR